MGHVLTAGRTVVVTGGAGFIGSHLCERLVRACHTVICVDNLSTGVHDNLGPVLGSPRFRFVQADVTGQTALADLVDGPADYVVHLASPASPEDYARLPLQTLRCGSIGTDRALALAASTGARFLLTSTSEVYGDAQVHPQHESYWGNVNPIGVRSVYDEAKRYAEALTMAYHREHGVDVGIARLFNTYGPRMRHQDGRLVPQLIWEALNGEPLTIHGHGEQTRSLCYVDDVVDGLISLLASGHTGPVNLGNPQEHTVNDIAALIAEVTGADTGRRHVPGRPDDPCRRRPDITLAGQTLGWSPRVGVREGLTETARWFRSRLAATAGDRAV